MKYRKLNLKSPSSQIVTKKITDAEQIRKFVKDLNALPLDNRTIHSCPMDNGTRAVVTLTGSGKRQYTVRLDMYCAGVTVNNGPLIRVKLSRRMYLRWSKIKN